VLRLQAYTRKETSSVHNCLCFLTGPGKWISLGLTLPKGTVTGYGAVTGLCHKGYSSDASRLTSYY
jgi:hypothetical protein